ncbi:LytTR family DNA-binding domain-containing protein [Weissella bombi]|uniref:Transcriptional regulator, LytTR family n=1 Tax=Weissella bombi TaxID=1505725 RepID=A0A1C4B832_9LACO|nr:LytTR family DNA-binding domain-containing protein [Weissella bombi]SCC03013.1 transcriptional regulator, LytTR family [Weissella bombi]
MRIKIMRLDKKSPKEDEVLFHVHEVTSTIDEAINVLKNNSKSLIATLINSEREEKISFHNIIYVEYLERQVFLYTKNKTYLLRKSLVNFKQKSPNYLVQISKNTLVNIYYVTAFTSHINGNLTLQLTSHEKLIVSRRYVVELRKVLKSIIE